LHQASVAFGPRVSAIDCHVSIKAREDYLAHLIIEPQMLPVNEYDYDAELGIFIPGAIIRSILNGSCSIYSHEHLRVQLPLPDFSMTFNAMCICVTVMLISLISVLKRLWLPVYVVPES
jgi:hypothetical protein